MGTPARRRRWGEPAGVDRREQQSPAGDVRKAHGVDVAARAHYATISGSFLSSADFHPPGSNEWVTVGIQAMIFQPALAECESFCALTSAADVCGLII